LSVGVTGIADSDYGEDMEEDRLHPEQKARVEIDRMLVEAGWIVHRAQRTRNGHLPAMRDSLRAHRDEQAAKALLLACLPVRAAVG
jgi:hypothetical protein